MKFVYLDHNATSTLRPQVLEAMLPYWQMDGNPSSIHRHGRLVRQAIETAREQVAHLINAHPSEIIFTSGGTEANNLAILGLAHAQSAPGHLLIGALEHDSVIKTAESLKQRNWTVATLGSDMTGLYHADALQAALKEKNAVLCSLMLANNETGVVQPIAALADIARYYGAIVHTDAVQSIGKMPIDFNASGVSMMTLSAHKIGGPVGVGALVKRADVHLSPILFGGGQEQGLRSGTENIALIVGFGQLCALLKSQQSTDIVHFRGLQQYIQSHLAAMPDVQLIASESERLPNTILLGVRQIEGEMLLMSLDKKGISVSSGSACGNLSAGGSHVLQAMKIAEPWASNTIRVSLGWNSTQADCDAFILALQAVVQEAQAMSWR